MLIALMLKLCEIIGDAICKAIEDCRQFSRRSARLDSRQKILLRDILRESICGPDADDAALDDTIVGYVFTFGRRWF